MGRTFTLNDELRWLSLLAPASQADLLLRVAQEARLLHLALDGRCNEPMLARDLERALNGAMDAEPGAEADDAADRLVDVIQHAHRHGLRIKAEVSEVEVDGVLGACRLPVLSAVLSELPVAVN